MTNRRKVAAEQLSLFEAVQNTYAAAGVNPIHNRDLYAEVARRTGTPATVVDQTTPVGQAGKPVSLFKRQVRWAQQTLKHLGLLERVEDARSLWRLTGRGQRQLRQIRDGFTLLGFSTRLGLAVWGDCSTLFGRLDEPIHLCVTSPPYPLRQPRAYGNPHGEREYIDFICRALEPVIRRLAPGASLALNVGNDIFMPGAPDRSLYRERLLLALCERFGLAKMDELIWHNPAKPPAPVQWACIHRQQLRTAYEPVYWLTNDPARVFADNRRVLQPHTDRMRKLIAAGGERLYLSASDGAHRKRPGSYGNPTPGRIPTNVLRYGHTCGDQLQYKQAARKLGLPPHGAPFPLALADFLIRFLSRDGDLVVDPFAGSFTTAKAAEQLGRRWIATDTVLEYVRGAAERFKHAEGFRLNPSLDKALIGSGYSPSQPRCAP